MKTLKKLVSLALVLCTILCVFSFPATAGAASAKTNTVKKVTLNSKSETIYVGNTFQIVPTASNSKGKTVSSAQFTYKSSKTSVATVTKKGLVTAKKAGSAKITVTEKASGKSAKLSVKVVKFTLKNYPVKVVGIDKNQYGANTEFTVTFNWSDKAVKQFRFYAQVYDAFGDLLAV